MFRADLHVHTEISDCSMQTGEILSKAKEIGLTHIAFTDHDTTRCAAEQVKLAKSYGITAVTAVEMSAWDEESQKKVHILGYGYQKSARIEAIGKETLKKRDSNCKKQIEILKTLGYQIAQGDVEQLSAGCMYKQHILKYLLDSGQSEALFGKIYSSIFKNDGPCDFDIGYPDAAEVVKAIKADGGWAVLAHPGQQEVFQLVPRLVEAGLDGIECNHHAHGNTERKKAIESAREFGLFVTGGSDFHGIYEQGERALGSELAPLESKIIFNQR